MKPLAFVALLGCLATVFAAPADSTVKWCVTSDAEMSKCLDLARHSHAFSCLGKQSTLQCIVAIEAGEADAITLKGADIYAAGLKPYELYPIIAEEYSPSSETCYYSVAVVKRTSSFNIRDLQGKATCHTGMGDPEGWNIPIGSLVYENILPWAGVESKPLDQAVSEFFPSSCVPGGGDRLRALCKGDGSKTSNEPYYGNAGAFRCLADSVGEVAFVKHDAVPDSERTDYELLCKDNTRAPLDNYQSCNLGRVPANAIVSRNDPELAKFIWTTINNLQGFDLFSSANYAPARNLMFTDSTTKLVRVPENTDSFLYLGPEYVKTIRSLRRERNPGPPSSAIKWCSVGHAETEKCDTWSSSSMEDGQAVIECSKGDTVEECVKMIMNDEADAMAVDGGQVYTAGKCGLVPVMAEQYDAAKCDAPDDIPSSYFAVAVVKKGSGITWQNLQGKRSCHTGMGRTAGWNIPMGQIHKQTGDCDFSKFFPSGCAPGANISSSFCTQCAGSGATVGETMKCKPRAEEKYYGYAGAFRCLVEGAGDVAFIKHTIVPENSDGSGPEWAKSLNSADFELICPENANSVPITEYASCKLARVPSHAVVTRAGIRANVIRVLQDQQVKFGPNGSDSIFRMFESDSGKNLLFKDSTKCLQEVRDPNYASFLGDPYMTAMGSLRECSGSTPDLEKSCTFHTCP